MLREFLQHCLTMAITLLLVSILSFLCVTLAPGDAASHALGERVTPEALAYWRHQYGLDLPLSQRYLHWLAELLMGQGGDSLISQQPVSAVVFPAAQRSGLLALVSAGIVLVVGIGGGIAAACYQSRWPDKVLSTLTFAGLSTPEFIVATGLIVLFSVTLGWLPAVSLPPLSGTLSAHWRILVLPALTLGLVASCYVICMVRALLLNAVRAPWVKSARLNGVGLIGVLVRHILPVVVRPLAQILAATLPYLFGGAMVVERVYGYPGMGTLLLNALNARDNLLFQAAVMMCALITSLCWLVADMLTAVDVSVDKRQ